ESNCLLQLGPTLCDWEAQSLQFTRAGETKTIHGLQPSNIIQAQPEGIEKDTRLGHTCFAVCFQIESSDSDGYVPDEMQQLLQQYINIFRAPTTLPPPQDIEHHIVLKEGSNPVNVWPYRYVHIRRKKSRSRSKQCWNLGSCKLVPVRSLHQFSSLIRRMCRSLHQFSSSWSGPS
ncbi:unnamed protein product, partial [Brassica napus]